MTNGSDRDVQAKINSASTGDTVMLPSGTFVWASTVNCAKAIHIAGAGGGQIFARSLTSLTIGTGSKSFTLTDIRLRGGLAITAGQTLLVSQIVHPENYMVGTVSSFDSSTATVVLNAINSGGSGTTFNEWFVALAPQTIVTSSTSGADSSNLHSILNVTLAPDASIEVSGIQFGATQTTATHKCAFVHVSPNDASSGGNQGKTLLLHDIWFRTRDQDGGIFSRTNKILLWNFSADNGTDFQACGVTEVYSADNSVWTSNSTIGSRDTDGTANLYWEDGYVVGYNTASDFTNNAKGVVRHVTFYSAGLASHGADSTPNGMRHLEVYDCLFTFLGRSDGHTPNVNWWIFQRGGTLVATDNTFVHLSCTDFGGSRTDIRMVVFALRCNAGPYACWGATTPGIQYPCPHQIGWGYENDAAVSDPVYIWNNTILNGLLTVVPVDYPNDHTDVASCVYDGPGGPNHGATVDSIVDYVVPNRDYFAGLTTGTGTARPGYTKYAYPHPLRTAIDARIIPPSNLAATPGPKS